MRIIFLSLFLFSFLNISAQKLNYQKGELLVQLDDADKLALLKRNLSIDQVTFTEVITKPFPVIKLSFDYKVIDEFRLLKELNNFSYVVHAQLNHKLIERAIPDDPGFEMQWQYLQLLSPEGIPNVDIDADLAWDTTTGGVTPLGDTIVVCIIDDGLDFNHEDFGDNIWRNHLEIPDNGIDDDNNGYIDDVAGWNTYGDDGNVNQDGSHGTPVAGIVGAQGNNSIGVTGVNWDVKLMIVRGGGDEADALAAYAYPYYFRKLFNETNGNEGAFVVATNASWGVDYGQPEEAPIWCSFYDSLGVQGILNCGATANLNLNIDVEGDLPTGCSSDYLIAVTNVDQNDRKVSSAGYGLETIDLGAFGSETWTTGANNNYRSFGGTSGATPHVTGTIGLLYSAPCEDLANYARTSPASASLLIKNYILDGVDPNESLQDITSTGGRLNVNNAVINLMADCTGCPLATSVQFTNGDLDGFDIEWQQEDDNTQINLRFRSSMDEEWQVVENVSSPFRISDAAYCTEYEVEFQSICDSITNLFFGNYKHTTEGCCSLLPGDNLSFTLNDDDSAYIEIPSVLVAEDYILEVRQIGSSGWVTLGQNSNGLYEISSAEECSKYEFRFQILCAAANSEYYTFDGFHLACSDCTSLEYCDPKDVDADFEWIAAVEFDNDLYESGSGENGYESFLGIKSFNFRKEQIVEFRLVPGFEQLTYEEYFQIWIDFNHDGIFDEDIEFLYQSPGPSDSINVGSFIIPETAELGYTRMRVLMSYDSPSLSCGDEFFEYGETEDYCVFISEASTTKQEIISPIDIFPNPVSNVIQIKNLYVEGLIMIYDLSGKLVLKEKVSPINKLSLELPQSIDAGVYFINYKTNDKNWVTKFVKI